MQTSIEELAEIFKPTTSKLQKPIKPEDENNTQYILPSEPAIQTFQNHTTEGVIFDTSIIKTL